tara:strand:- start:1134 stop:2189 length:1056 start_codon:yes stop_codon:yes gene_type:complete
MTNLQAGRLGSIDMKIEDDPRTDPRIAEAIALDNMPIRVAPETSEPIKKLLEYSNQIEQDWGLNHDLERKKMPAFEQIEINQIIIKGVNDNQITLHIHRPAKQTGTLPAVVHTHGGGMTIMSAEDPSYVRWRSLLATHDLVVIGVEFRNAGGRLGNSPFPAGLNDCASATQWVFDNKRQLDVSSIIISGESGGGNLSIATALKAKKENWLSQINGVYACCPYISGSYENKPSELVSLKENDGYLINCKQMAVLAHLYDPNGKKIKNPLAWPYHSTEEDLYGLPPHFIWTNELDPLRDEGISFYRKLLAAGVTVSGQTALGTCHAAETIFPDVIPEITSSLAASIGRFARSL